jgi:hypothetical protein
MAVVCLLLTGVATWAAARVDENTENRLLDVQTKQAGTVLSTAIMLIQEPLTTALTVQKLAGPDGNATSFVNLMSAYVGSGELFESASLWLRRDGTLTRVAAVGAATDDLDGSTPAYL